MATATKTAEKKTPAKKTQQFKYIKNGVCAPKGFHATGIHAGFKHRSKKRDLALIFSEVPCSAAGVYTTNKVQGSAIIVTKEHLKGGKAQAVIVNSGNANTCAANGLEIAMQTCKLTGDALGITAEDVLVCSTGVIGKPLSIGPFEAGIPKAAKVVLTGDKKAKDYGSDAACEAIRTTDTFNKEVAVSFKIGEKTCHIGGIAKGSGMINPQMATMLGFITTDVAIDSNLLRECLKEDINHSFNQISIDGDTSTNDTVVILANGKAGNKRITSENAEFDIFAKALNLVTVNLAKKLARDGEGATKLIECRVSGAPKDDIAMTISKTVIQSDLVKTAIFGSDANWGRVLCAVGYSPGTFNVDNVDVVLRSKAGDLSVCKGSKDIDFDEVKAKKILGEEHITILVNLHDGMAEAEAYGCDLTYGYVKINGMYRT
ncbi:MAG: bifunctional glutamate N-acetyltransferase/amino-acid acetyltransferase ArgJ [Clostridiales Family XIII bacterium]|jgi:glutamate N-acetyltransferase/amino-acid N-acetyltransferase|nr:bifunctional glutamate N-acetyltransferase/amino-acid acetyltransferase ArgJ [Clostridiales Family XIII bacterium]